MTEMSDEEIWDALNNSRLGPSLFERAKMAASEKKAAEAADRREEVVALEYEALKLMRDVLRMSDAEMNAAKENWRGVQHNNERMRVEFTADRWHFRVFFRVKPINITNAGEKIAVGEEMTPVYEMRPKQSSQFKVFTELADLVSGMAIDA